MLMKPAIEAYERYMLAQRGYSQATVSSYREACQALAERLYAAGITEASAVGRRDVVAWLEHQFVGCGNRNATRARKLAAVKGLWRYLAYEQVEGLDMSILDIPTPKREVLSPSRFTTRQLQSLFSAPDLTRPQGVRDMAILTLLYSLGLRREEVVSLNLGDITDTGQHMLCLIRGKGRKQRTLYLRPSPARAVRAWLLMRARAASADPLFVSFKGSAAGGRLGSRSINLVLASLASRVRLDDVHVFVHKLRSTWASDLYDESRDVFQIAALAGWDDINTARRYIAISSRALMRASLSTKRWREVMGGPDESA